MKLKPTKNMTAEQIKQANTELRTKSPLEIVRWAIAQAPDKTIVSTNFRPYEAVILHLATQVKPDIQVLWADHGYNRPATYRHAEELKKLLKLNIQAFVPRMTAAHYDAIHGGAPWPTPENEQRIIIPTVYRNNYLAALKALSQGENPKPIIPVLDFAQKYTTSIRWENFDIARSDLQETNAFKDSTEAEDNGIRLVLPKNV